MVALPPCARDAMLVYSIVPSLRVILYTAPRFGAGGIASTDTLNGAALEADAGCVKEERVGARCGCEDSSSFGRRLVAMVSITAIGHGLAIGSTPSAEGSALTTGALGACNGVILITAGFAFTSFDAGAGSDCT